ncbi:MAG: hypothetical protein K0Q59_1455 [Paenibacillus sp.]|nr:hypothetical protein [Paenibacillus sp.]
MSGKTSQRLFRARLDSMIEQLTAQIRSGKIAPGEYLPSEVDLAKQFALSNKSVRQGLDLLVEEQLIRKIPRVGNQVIGSTEESAITIRLGYEGSMERDAALYKLLMLFQHRYPAVRVKTVRMAASDNRTVKAYCEDGLIDVWLISDSAFMEMADNGQVQLFEPLPPEPEVYPFLEEAFMFDGTVYARPVLFSPLVLGYNKAHFREAKVAEPDSSWTWGDCLNHARKLYRERRRYGLLLNGESQPLWTTLLLQSGMKFERSKDGLCDRAGTALLDSLRMYRSLLHDPALLVPPLYGEDSDIVQLFADGHASMIVTSYSALNGLTQAELDYDICPLPYFVKPRTVTGAAGACLSAASLHKQEASLLIRYFGSDEGQHIIRQETLSIPARKRNAEAAVPAGLNRPSRFDLFRDILPYMRFPRDLNLNRHGFEQLWKLMTLYGSRLIDDMELADAVSDRLSEHIR